MKVVVNGREATVSDTSFQDTTPALFSDGYPVPRKYTCAKCGLHKAAPVYRYIIPGSVNGVICLGCRNRLLQGAGQAAAPVVRPHRRKIGIRGIAAIAIVVLVILGLASTMLSTSGGSTTSSTTSSYSFTSSTNVTSAVGAPAFSSAPTILAPPTQGDAPGSCTHTATTFTCTGTTVQRGESYSVRATIDNPASRSLSVTFTSEATPGWQETPQSGSYILAPGQNALTWTMLWPASLNVTTLSGQIQVEISGGTIPQG